MFRPFKKYIKINLYYISRVHCSGKANTPVLKTSKKMFKSAIFNLQEASKDQVKEFLNSFDTVLSDCDGKSKVH